MLPYELTTETVICTDSENMLYYLPNIPSPIRFSIHLYGKLTINLYNPYGKQDSVKHRYSYYYSYLFNNSHHNERLKYNVRLILRMLHLTTPTDTLYRTNLRQQNIHIHLSLAGYTRELYKTFTDNNDN